MIDPDTGEPDVWTVWVIDLETRLIHTKFNPLPKATAAERVRQFCDSLTWDLPPIGVEWANGKFSGPMRGEYLE